MTKTQKEIVQEIQNTINNDIESKNARFNKNSSVTYKIEDGKYFVSLVINYQYSDTPNYLLDNTIIAFIGKRGKLEGYKTSLSPKREVKPMKLYEFYF